MTASRLTDMAKKHYTKLFRIPYRCSRCGETFYRNSPETTELICDMCAFKEMEKDWWREARDDAVR